MKLGSATKQPADNLDYDIHYDEWLEDSGDVLVSATVTATPSGLDIGAAVVTDQAIKVWLSSGSAGVGYKVEVTVTTNGGRIKQDEFTLRVKEF